MAMLFSVRLLIAVAGFACLFDGVQGHGHMTSPPARWPSNLPSWENWLKDHGNCNPDRGAQNCRNPTYGVEAAVCGGPFQHSPSSWSGHFIPTNFAWGASGSTSYASGATISLGFHINVAHTAGAKPGWMEARLCASGTPTAGCAWRKLTTNTGATTYYGLWAVGDHTVSFKLPDGVTCSQCVLQWIWQTSSWDGATGEEFHNCADITIGGGSTSGGGGGGGGTTGPSGPSSPTTGTGSPTGTCDVNSVCSTAGAKAAPCACSSDCTKFVNCANGVGYLQPCGSGLVFNPNGYCDWPASYKCPC